MLLFLLRANSYHKEHAAAAAAAGPMQQELGFVSVRRKREKTITKWVLRGKQTVFRARRSGLVTMHSLRMLWQQWIYKGNTRSCLRHAFLSASYIRYAYTNRTAINYEAREEIKGYEAITLNYWRATYHLDNLEIIQMSLERTHV